MEWGLLIAGLFVGIMIGITGIGGGSLMTPILIFGFAIKPTIAVGTDLLFAAITKVGGIAAYLKHGAINWVVVKRLGLGSIPMTILTLLFLNYLGADDGKHSNLITTSLGVALILTSSALLLKGLITSILLKKIEHPVVNMLLSIRNDEQHKTTTTILIGAFLGVMVTISSVGAGALGVVTLLFLYPKMNNVQIVATDIAHAVPLTAIAGIGHLTVGTVDWSLLLHLVIGSLPGIYIGSHLGINITEHTMRLFMAILLLLVGMICLL